MAKTTRKRKPPSSTTTRTTITTTTTTPALTVASLVLPALYLGPCSAASSRAFLASAHITHVLSIGATPSRRVAGVSYHRLSLADSPSSSLSGVADAASAIIDAVLASNTTSTNLPNGQRSIILVHCMAGISRSPSIILAYLMQRHRLPLLTALQQVARARPQVLPNPGFLRQLKVMEVALFGATSVDVDDLPRCEKDRLALLFKDKELAAACPPSP